MKIVNLFFLFFLVSAAQAQSVQQSGNVTPGHAPIWLTTGVIGDAGSAASGNLSSVGVTASGFGICQNSAPINQPYNQICLGVSSTGGTILFSNVGGASGGFNFNVNGTVYQFPFAVGGIVGPGSTLVGNAACWNNTAGTLLKQCDVVNSQTSAYAVQPSDCGERILLSGGSFYTVTESGVYGTGCRVSITNNDPIPTGSNSTGAKFVSFVNCTTGESGTYVWPQQTLSVYYTGSTWIPDACPGPWQIPQGLTLNYDPVNGSDTWGTSDGLATGARAFATANSTGYVFANGMMTSAVANDIIIKCSVNGGTCSTHNDATPIHWAFQSGAVTGLQGYAGITLNCNGANETGSPSMALFLPGTTVEPTNCTFTNGVTVNDGARLYDVAGGGNTYCGPANGQAFDVTYGGTVKIQVNSTICSGVTLNYLVVAAFHSVFTNTGTMTFSGSITFNNYVYFESGISMLTVGTISGGGSVSGGKYDLVESSFLSGASSVPGSGTSVCATCGTD